MWKIRQALARFMYGRYGVDKLYNFLFIVWAVLAVANVFIGSYIIYLCYTAILIFSLYRCLSKNIYRRQRENAAYLRMAAAVKGFFSILFSRIRDIGTKRYRRCKYCRSMLRLPIKRGKHTVHCPKCQNNFSVNIII